ncbi:hypothetical protein MHU86_23103 [Fragilaria crotonensis]|nr:hypothetical protein MHU86_23103 [Fragilaria crotonensis]
MVKRSHVAVQWLMRVVAEVAPRPGAMGNNTIKTHLVLHLCEDILDHGVPENVNSSYAESAHIPLAKVTSRNTQKRAVSFTKQAAHRYIENLVVSLASADMDTKKKRCLQQSRSTRQQVPRSPLLRWQSLERQRNDQVGRIPRNYPAFIHTFVDLRGLPNGERINIKANGQKNLEAGLYAVAHSFDPVSVGDLDTPNTLIGRYTPHFHSPERHPTLFLVDVKSILSPVLGIEDAPIGVEKAPRRKRCHLFLIRRKAEWPQAWDSLINKCHHDLEHDVDDDTWFEEEYEKEFVSRLPSGRGA